MRSVAKDSSRIVTLTNILIFPGTVDGTGHFSDGTPWRLVRASVGQYDIFFDPRLVPINGVAGTNEQARQYYWVTQTLGGFVHVRCMFHDGTQVDGAFDLVLNCIDTRV